MINAIGIADFNFKPTQTSNYKLHVSKKINGIKNKFADNYEVVSVSEPFDIDGDIHVRVSCSFNIHLPEIAYCRSIDDYVGHVFPTLKQRLSSKLISTKVHSLTRILTPDEKKYY
ncbi:hypothetical protein CEQ21_21240 [Niallia circulans]|uniref:Uncharacterized protein n=1 Tax=Niallia circulans TaxID=1397 RepID=A0A553SLS5_NIACI|nr:hypothetical protein [Niallia circulans]TRZ37945.1 hypothetical protein CEQ21_21240 [Niallia circulans]